MIYSDLRKILPEARIVKKQALKEFTSMRVGGDADIFVEAKTQNEIVLALEYARKQSIPYYIIGEASNVIFKDNGFAGIVIKIANNDYKIIDRKTIIAGAAVHIAEISYRAMLLGLSGLEYAQGIPGSVGGAVIMNAGAYNGQTSNILKKVKYINKDSKVMTRVIVEGDLGYRTSIFAREDLIVLTAEMELNEDKDGKAREKYEEFRLERISKQPLEYPSCGSVFKRPEGHYTGKLVRECGLVGKKVGGAMVSQKHAGFIVNYDNATASDVLNLIDIVKEEVYKMHSVKLECEVKIVGD